MPLPWMHLASEGQYGYAPHLWYLNRIALLLAGRHITRAIIELPPRHGKSTFFSQYFPAWWLGRFPDQRVMITSAVADLAKEWSGQARDALVGYGEQVFGVRVARAYQASSSAWEIQGRLGRCLAAGIGGPITGRGADLLIIDDPIKNAMEAESPTLREHQWAWLQSTALPRLEPRGVAILIMARWHQDDLAGRLLDPERTAVPWTRIRLPALAEPDDALGRAEGDPLWTARFPLAALQRLQIEAGAWWDPLYQCSPTPPGGAIFLTKWWDPERARYDADALALPDAPRVVGRWIFLDTAMKDERQHDYTADTVLELLADYRLRVRQVWQDKLQFPFLLARIEDLWLAWNTDGKLQEIVIEDKASGTSAYQTLVKSAADPALRRALRLFTPHGSKVYRAKQAALWCALGRVLLPQPSASVPWLFDFTAHLRDFPRGAHDDDIDSFTMGVLYLENFLARGIQGQSLVGATT